MNKRLIILDLLGGGRLGNQLWNLAGLYAYCLEKNYSLESYAFFDYSKFFNVPLPKNLFARFFFYTLNQINFYRKFRVYEKCLPGLRKLLKHKIIEEDRINPFYLPPTPNAKPEQTELIQKIEKGRNKVWYTSGWLFRNPVGIEKYRKEIVSFLRPKKNIMKKVEELLSPLRKSYKKVVGIHIRQTDYRIRRDGKPFPFYFTEEEVRKIMDDYLDFNKLAPDEIVFVICSDEDIDIELFSGLNFIFSGGDAVEDMFTLSQTDLILGNDSTFGSFASYFSNIPFIVFERPRVDWGFYKGKDKYFENKKNILTWY